MKSTPQFLESEIEVRAAADCRFQVIPVPFEATVSYGGGTAGGPAAILEASCQLETPTAYKAGYNQTGCNLPLEQGIFTWPAVDCSGPAEMVLERIEAAVEQALASGPRALPVLLGGEHSVTLGALRALKKRYGQFGVIQFDAHADLRDSYEGSPYSHACVMRRAVDDLGLALLQFGVRSLSPEEVEFRKLKEIPHLDASQAMFPLSSSFEPTGIIPDDFPHQAFLTFDIDALDASLMPATGTPEPGGLFWWDALRLVEASLSGRTCLGFDVVELAPIAGLHAPDFTAARLVYEIMGIIDAAR